MDVNNPQIKTGETIDRFEVKAARYVADIDAHVYLFEHVPTRARHLHISNQDAENVFGVALKTIPQDATGVAHILEHTVLCGSRHYPVRDPFFAMLRRSLSTFMNAFTASDWTMYPFATQNTKDFYNLMDVYLDAVFFPNLDHLSFLQEGIRLDLETASDPSQPSQTVYKGVVYNEMKGAMSSPDQVLGDGMTRALFPDTTYRFNSGGDPQVIPQLDHPQLKAFHARFYHPSNAYFFTYGNLPLRRHLDFIEEKVLSGFTAIDPRADVPHQPRWPTPRQATVHFPLDDAEAPDQKHQVSLSWLTVDIADSYEVLLLTILEQILLGNAASPLRQVLIDSGLGATLSDHSGYDPQYRDTIFSCGLKETRPGDAAAIEKLILDQLTQLVDQGLDTGMIDTAVHQIEFHRKEITNSPYPYGLKLFLGIVGSWIHGGAPMEELLVEDQFRRLRRDLAQGTPLEDRIRLHLVDNAHRLRLLLSPDKSLESRRQQTLRRELDGIQERLTDDDLAHIVGQNRTLEARQAEPEDVSCLPTLGLNDVPETVPRVSATPEFCRPGIDAYRQPTSGIFYASLIAGLGHLPDALAPLVPFFCYALPKMGTGSHDYLTMAQRIDAATGGLTLGNSARTSFSDKGACLPFLALNTKCLDRNLSATLDLMDAFLTDYSFGDQVRLNTLLQEYRAHLESAIVHQGHQLAITAAARGLTVAGGLREAWHGISQIRTIKAVAKNTAANDLTDLAEQLGTIARLVFKPRNLRLALVGGEVSLASSLPAAERLLLTIGADHKRASVDESQAVEMMTQAPLKDINTVREGWQTSTAVSFVAQVMPAPRLDHPDAPALAVMARVLRANFLHREIREKGGAYGGFAGYNAEDGLFSLGSYRDPHVVATLDAYQRAFDFIRSNQYSTEDVKEAILQVCGDIDKPDPPGPAAKKAFLRKLVGVSDEVRQQYKQRLLKIDREAVRRAADALLGAPALASSVAVVSNAAKLEAANQQLADQPLKIEAI